MLGTTLLAALLGIGHRPSNDPLPPAVADIAVERAKRLAVPEPPAPMPPTAAGLRAPVPPRPPLAPAAAAKRFLCFLQDEEFIGDQQWAGRKGLWQLYLWHCLEDNLTPIPDNRLAEAFGKLSRKRLIRDRSSGQLRRLTVYSVPASRRKVA